MKTTVQTLISIALLSISLLAQEKSRTCPLISVVGPSDVVVPGHIANFTVEVKAEKNLPSLQYKWSVCDGEIVSGQGTTAIKVRQPKNSITATVEVIGLLNGCQNTASDTTIYEALPAMIKLEHFTIPVGTIASDRIEKIWQRAYSEPNAAIYLVTSFANTSTAYMAKQRLELERQIMGQTKDGIYITNLDCRSNDDFIDMWLVPPGATLPTCQESEATDKSVTQQTCPAISVLGPADVALPGELVTFRALIEGALPGDVKFRWTTNGGEIVAGQGTLTLKVKAPKIDEPLTATFELIGLQKGCRTTASETYVVVANAYPGIQIRELTK